jgi:hypothetical protein
LAVIQRLCVAVGRGLALALLVLTGPAARADCPPQASAPSQAQVQAGQREARDRGPLWRLEKDGREAWLYGTLHVGKLAWVFPGPQLTKALQASDTVALELDLGDPAVLAALARGQEVLRQREAAQPVPAALRARLTALAAAACVDAPPFRALPAVLQASALAVLSARRDGLDPAYGQDAVLAALARASGKTLVSLESAEAQLALLAPADPAALAPLLRRTAEQLETGQARGVLVRLADLWAAGDLDALAQYAHWCGCVVSDEDRAELVRLNDGRNPALADAIAALHASGRRVLAAVGALHMTGPASLPALLAARGFRVERVERVTETRRP